MPNGAEVRRDIYTAKVKMYHLPNEADGCRDITNVKIYDQPNEADICRDIASRMKICDLPN